MIDKFLHLFSKNSSEEGEETSLQEFHRIYLENRDFVRASIYLMIRSDNTNDLVQETFLKAWRGYKNFKGESLVRSWLYRIAMNTTKDYLKKKELNYSDLNVIEQSDNGQNEENILFENQLTRALLKLSHKQREVFILSFKWEYTQEEISEVLNVPLGTVKTRLMKGKKIFADSWISEEGQYER